MDSLVIQGVVAAVVVGAFEGWHRVGRLRAMANATEAAGAKTQQLGANLGPRVQVLERQVATLKAKLGIVDEEKKEDET